MGDASSKSKFNPWMRLPRFIRRCVLAILALILLSLATPRIVGWIIGYKLRSEIAARLNATLETGKVTYLPPYGVRIERATLNTNDPAAGKVALLDVALLELTLAKLPLGTGPLVIEKLQINAPTIHIVHTAAGLAGSDGLTKDSGAVPQAHPKKLSDLFELRHLAISNGSIEYDDIAPKIPAAPVIWKHLEADLRTTPTSRSGYSFTFAAEEAPVASIQANGSLDIDSLLLEVQPLSITAQAVPGQLAEQLPTQLQKLLKKFNVGGTVTLDAAARVPLADSNRGIFTAKVQLHDGTCYLPQWNAPIQPVEFSFQMAKLPNSTATTVPTTLPAELAEGPTDVRFFLNNLSLKCGRQILQLDGGQGRYTPTDGNWAVGRVRGLADVGDGPGPVHDADVWVRAPFIASGFGNLWPVPDFTLRFGIDDGSLIVPPNRIPLHQVAGLVVLNPAGATAAPLSASSCGGRVTARGGVTWSSVNINGVRYDGQGTISDVDMRQVGDLFLPTEIAREKLSGTGDLHLKFSGVNLPNSPDTGADSPGDRFFARGDLDIRHGHFFEIPVLKNVMKKSQHDDAGTVGEAAATFSISHRKLEFEEAAASAPAVGVQGNGSISFDGNVDMSFVVTPLADWRKNLEQSKSGFWSNIGSTIAGGAQYVVNGVERVAIYQFRVNGSLNDPQVRQVPVPFVTDSMRPLFEMMSGSNQDDSVSRELRRRRQERAATQPAIGAE